MRGSDNDLTDEMWDVRETYAAFGRAYYMACVLEVGLAHALMYGEFLLDKLVLNKGKDFDLKQYQSEFDTYMDSQFAKTMGNIIRRIDALPYFNDELKSRIKIEKKRRDLLAHSYWREKSIGFATEKGRAMMQNELHADAKTFGILDKDIEAALKPARERLGIDDEKYEAQSRILFEQMKGELSWE